MKTPVLLIAFNRPAQTRRVIDAIVSSGATNVFVAIDGPRDTHREDAEKTAEVRGLIDNSPWPGTITTLYRPKNLGCREGVSGAISWFFEHVDEGIILEDDCLPNPTFFGYAEELLEHYRDDPRVGMISGSTFFPLPKESAHSYTFSRYPHIWGWATWKRAWDYYDKQLSGWGQPDSLDTLIAVSGASPNFVRFWKRLLDGVKRGEVDTWDYIWSYSFWRAGFLSVSPGVNLIENTGFSSDATHTRGKPLVRAFRPKASELTLPLTHPGLVETNERLERITRSLAMGVNGKYFRTLARLMHGTLDVLKHSGEKMFVNRLSHTNQRDAA